MKFVVGNSYIKSYEFSNALEMEYFIKNQNILKLTLVENFGENNYCYVFHDALTHEKKSLLSFSSDEKEDDIYILFWFEYGVWIVCTGKFIYIIDDKMQIKIVLEVLTPLVGMYLLPHKKHVLILEEASVRVIDHHGEVLKNEKIGFVNRMSIQEGFLSIYTDEGVYNMDIN